MLSNGKISSFRLAILKFEVQHFGEKVGEISVSIMFFLVRKETIMTYTHLTDRERYYIEWQYGKLSLRKIAKALERHVSTISREIERCFNSGFDTYLADYKEKSGKIIKKTKQAVTRGASKLKGKLLKTVKYYLKKKWSPEQISGRLFLEKGIRISHQAIYNWIEKEEKKREKNKEENKNEFTQELRIKSLHKHRNKNEKVRIKDLITIDKREEKSVLIQTIGNLELDTILGKGNKSAILTMVDMMSKYVFIVRVDGTKAKSTEEAVINTLKYIKNHIKTLTMDNGREFCNHMIFGKALNAKTYFTHPHSPWENKVQF